MSSTQHPDTAMPTTMPLLITSTSGKNKNKKTVDEKTKSIPPVDNSFHHSSIVPPRKTEIYFHRTFASKKSNRFICRMPSSSIGSVSSVRMNFG